jgi:hypothetical protein
MNNNKRGRLAQTATIEIYLNWQPRLARTQRILAITAAAALLAAMLLLAAFTPSARAADYPAVDVPQLTLSAPLFYELPHSQDAVSR